MHEALFDDSVFNEKIDVNENNILRENYELLNLFTER